MVQFAQMQSAGFWESPLTAFRYDGPMDNTMLTYRRAATAPLLSSAFRAIPPRELPDDDANLIRSIVRRTCALLSVAESIFTTLKDDTLDVSVKYKRMSDKINGTPKLGPTSTKMLLVSVDLAYPKVGLCASKHELLLKATVTTS